MSASTTGPSPDEHRPRGRFRFLLPKRSAHRRGAVSRQRLENDLATCRQELTRWQRYADSYAHELDRAGHERAHLLAWLAALHPASAVVVRAVGTGRDGTDGTDFLRLVAGGWHMSWPIPPGELPLFEHVPYEAPAPGRAVWRPEESADRDARIRRHTRLLALEGTLHSGPAGRRSPTRPDGR